ncbi:MAG: hypothetical protein ACXVXK_20125, partial [Blastococcus sp.]
MVAAHRQARACTSPVPRSHALLARCMLAAGLLAALFVIHGLTAEHQLPRPHETSTASASHGMLAPAALS